VHLVREIATQLRYARLEPFNVLSLVLADRHAPGSRRTDVRSSSQP